MIDLLATNNAIYCDSLTVMNKLPMERLSVVDQLFYHTDIDYFGPLLVKLNKRTRRNQIIVKRYGAIFTCLSSLALHI